MKQNGERRGFLRYVPLGILGLTAVGVIGLSIYEAVLYRNGRSIEHDKTANVNVMLTRPEDWKHIGTGQIRLTKEDFFHIDGSTATIPITAELARQFCDAPDEAIGDYVDHNTTHYAYEYLITGGCPHNSTDYHKTLIFVTQPSEDELALAGEHHVELEVQPVALDGFVFITHKDNPVDSLTAEQIRKIYSGEITNWKEVGGADAKIIPYQRERNSGSQTAMEELVMQGTPLMEPEVGYTIPGMGELVEVVGEYENAANSLGYTYYYYLNNLYRSDDIKVLQIDGISPDNGNLTDRSYPFTTAYYAVIRGDAPDKARELRDYLLTDEGQQIIKMAGYCPVRTGE